MKGIPARKFLRILWFPVAVGIEKGGTHREEIAKLGRNPCTFARIGKSGLLENPEKPAPASEVYPASWKQLCLAGRQYGQYVSAYAASAPEPWK